MFNPRNIRPFATILFAGGRRTGKSFTLRDFMYWLRRKVYDCEVYSGSYDDDHPWENYTPGKYVSYVKQDFPDEKLQEGMDRQEHRKDIARKYHVDCPASMFVFEDLEFLTTSMWKNQAIRELMFNGRWKKSYCLAAVQYIMEIKCAVRGMFDYAVFMMENSAAVRKRIFEQFGGIFPTVGEFESVFFRCTEDHKAMVIDCRSTSYKVEDTIFWYKATDRGFFHMGVPEVWDDTVDERNRRRLEAERRSLLSKPGMSQPPPRRAGRGKNAPTVGVRLHLDDDAPPNNA
jgi:hypothetical protein